MIKLIEFVDSLGRNPFVAWRRKLDDVTRARVTIALVRLEEGNTSKLKGVGRGIVELRLDFGPGYRVYLAWDGPAAIVLLGAGSKARQQVDIDAAYERWTEYKRRKRQGEL
jgi:putative addiction module killer protein